MHLNLGLGTLNSVGLSLKRCIGTWRNLMQVLVLMHAAQEHTTAALANQEWCRSTRWESGGQTNFKSYVCSPALLDLPVFG